MNVATSFGLKVSEFLDSNLHCEKFVLMLSVLDTTVFTYLTIIHSREIVGLKLFYIVGAFG